MNRKGDLVNNSLELIIAVIGIALLFYAAYLIYDRVVNSEAEDAKNILNTLETRVNSISEGETTATIQGFKGSEKWSLVGWSSTDPKRPDKCYFESCVCVCPLSNAIDFDASNICQSKGFCRSFDLLEVEVLTKQYYKLGEDGKPPAGLDFEKCNNINLGNSLSEIKVIKSDKKISLVQEERDKLEIQVLPNKEIVPANNPLVCGAKVY